MRFGNWAIGKPSYKKAAILSYGAALLSVLAALGIRLAAWPVLGNEAPFLFFVAAVVFSAWYGGFGPGVFATVFSYLLADYYLVPPLHTLLPAKASQVVWMLSFLLTGALISWLMENLHAANRVSEAIGREAAQRAADIDCLNRELREADHRKNEFLAMLAHELRNPLAAILHAITVLKLRGPADPTLQRARDTAERQVKHMSKLMDDLLDVSRITLGKIELQHERVDLATIVNRALQTIRALRGDKTYYVSLPPDPLILDADPARLEQILNNLLDNAAKYTASQGHIWIEVAREGEKAVLVVRDDGMGMSPELLSHIFDLFVQGDRPISRTQGGLGIGLTLVRHLVEKHGGSVEAHSDGAGRGSEFIVRLPLLPVNHAVCLQSGGTAPTGVRRKILVVEDNVDSAEMLGNILAAEGHEVQVAHDGTSAMVKALEYSPDVILMDIGLPGMNGYEVAERLRREPCMANVKLIALTGYGQHEDVLKSKEAGFHYHLTKPVDIATLRRALS